MDPAPSASMPFASYTGQIAAVGAAVLWTASALFFTAACKRIGSVHVNLLRLLMALVFSMPFAWLMRGAALPIDATASQWLWLGISGAIGFFLSDLCLFEAYVRIGPRLTTLFFTVSPPVGALLGWIFLGERMVPVNLLGMAITIAGVVWVVVERPLGPAAESARRSPFGMLLAFFFGVGNALSFFFAKLGMGDLPPLAAAQVRMIAGLAGFLLLFTFARRWRRFFAAFRHGAALGVITAGAFVGPFVGVVLSMVAIKYAYVGVVTTILTTIPVMIIPFAIVLYHERITLRAVLGALLAVLGVALLFVGR